MASCILPKVCSAKDTSARSVIRWSIQSLDLTGKQTNNGQPDSMAMTKRIYGFLPQVPFQQQCLVPTILQKKWCEITMINPLSTKQVESKVKTSQMLYCRTLSSILNLLSRNSSLSIQTDSGTDVLGFTTKSPLQRLKPSRHRISWLSITTQMSEVKLHYQFLKSPHYATTES